MSDELSAIRKACDGLHFTSETESPVEPVAWPAEPGCTTETRVRREVAGEVALETMTLAAFFRAVPKADRPKFDALAKVLNEQLQGVQVYKLGRVRMDVFIVGERADGGWAGVKLKVVET
jgi:hypothetical protein